MPGAGKHPRLISHVRNNPECMDSPAGDKLHSVLDRRSNSTTVRFSGCSYTMGFFFSPFLTGEVSQAGQSRIIIIF